MDRIPTTLRNLLGYVHITEYKAVYLCVTFLRYTIDKNNINIHLIIYIYYIIYNEYEMIWYLVVWDLRNYDK